jgi:hypothetical protein
MSEEPKTQKEEREIGRIRKKYTRAEKIFNRWSAFVEIDGQGFCIAEDTTYERAKWFCRLAAIALIKLRKIENDAQK